MKQQIIPLPLQPIQGLIGAAQRGGEIKYVPPETFREIAELVRTQDAQGRSKIEQDALAMLMAGVVNQMRTRELQQWQRWQRRNKKHKKGAA